MFDYYKFLMFCLNYMILCIIGIGCCQCVYYNAKNKNLHEHEIKKIENKIKNYNSPVVSNNFIYLERYIMADEKGNICHIEQGYDNCKKRSQLISSASGYVIRKDNKNSEIYALTASHWCEREKYPESYMSLGFIVFNDPFLENFGYTFEGTTHVEIIAKDSFADICLIKFKSLYPEKYKNIKIAKKEPHIGETVYTQSSPLGLYGETIRFNLEGKYSGCSKLFCFFTIKAAPGSSGSSVINSRGEIVSIITAVIVDFDTISLGPTLEQLQNFMEKYDEKIRH